ncbi:MAG: type II toxin-antitoxin system RelE/ParE family toxin [Nitrospira sp.]
MPYIDGMQTVVETPGFIKDARDVGLSEDEREGIVEFISENPLTGVSIPGTVGARKVRFSAKGKGKSGGVRVITFYSGIDIPVFLLNVFAKGDKVNLTKAECNTLKNILGSIADAYRNWRK